MKVKLLPLAIGAAIAMPGVAMAAPTVYGKMNVTYENSDLDVSVDADGVEGSDSADTWELNSNASRLGVKGSENISDDLSAFYKAEYEIMVDDGDKGGDTFSQRDIYVGLKGGWGAVQLGNYDTPFKKTQGKVDQFNDMSAGDIKNVLVGENRESDLIQYTSPAIADAFTVTVAVQAGEEYCPDGSAGDCQDGPAENFSVALVYDDDTFYAALGQDDGINGYDATRLVGMMKMDAFEFGAIYQTAEESEGDDPAEQDGYILSAAMNIDSKNKIRFQYGYSELEDDAAGIDSIASYLSDDVDIGAVDVAFAGELDAEVTQIALGYDHKLSKQTKLFANYIMLETEFEMVGGFDTPPVQAEAKADVENTRIQFGVEHKF